MNRQEALKKFVPVVVKVLGPPARKRAATYAADYLNRRRENRREQNVAVSSSPEPVFTPPLIVLPTPAETPEPQTSCSCWYQLSFGLIGIALGVIWGLIFRRRM